MAYATLARWEPLKDATSNRSPAAARSLSEDDSASSGLFAPDREGKTLNLRSRSAGGCGLAP